MKLGFIMSEGGLEKYGEKLDTFHLILPHLFVDHSYYKDFYQHRASKGDFVMVDNSIFELESALDGKQLLDYAKQVNAAEVVAPEVLGDAKATIKLVRDFIDLVKKDGNDIRIAATAQGASVDELLACYQLLYDLDGVDTICMPFDIDYPTPFTESVMDNIVARRVRGRIWLMNRIAKLRWTKKPVHLLGLQDPIELSFQKSHAFIRSNDSSSAFLHGFFHHKINPVTGLSVVKIPQKMDFKWEVRGLYQDECITHNINAMYKIVETGSNA